MRFIESSRRVGAVLAVLLAATACTTAPGPSTGQDQENIVTTNLSAYTAGQDIVVNYSNMGGNETDWIALALTTDPDDAYEAWQYTGGGTSGTLTFTAPNLPAGTYEARAYYDWIDTSSFTVQQRSPAFTVGGGALITTVSTDKPTYNSGDTVTLTYANMPGNQFDWVAVSVAGSSVTAVVQWDYTNGMVNGSQAFTGLAAGNYEARAYRDDQYELLAKSTFTIAPAAGTTSVTTDQSSYLSGQTVNLTWSNMPGNPTDYVAVAVAGSPASSTVATAPTNGAQNGSAPFTGLAAGSYEARGYLSGTTTILATSQFVVTAATSATVSTDSSSYAVGQTVTVTYGGLPGNATDWISIATLGSPDTSYVQYQFTGGAVGGSIQFTGLPAGTYEARAYPNNTYNVIARSASFAVAGSLCTPPPAPPVLSGLTSGDLTMGSAAQSASALLSVNLTTSVLFTTLEEDEKSPDFGAVICELHGDDPDLGSAGVTCRRNDVGTDESTSTGTITIHWTVATFSSGVSVQRGEVNTNTANPADVTLTSIDPSSSFVLLGGDVNGGTAWGTNEFLRAEILDATTLEIRAAAVGTTAAWQVVQMTGASVQRGSATFGTSDTEQTVSITSAPSGSLVLASYTTDNASGVAAAELMMQSTFASPTSLDFKRAASGTNLDVSWEVVSLPFATYSGIANFAAGGTSDSIIVTGIAASTSVAIGSSQAILGQSGGSTTYAGADGDLVGEGAASMSTGSGSLLVTRSASQSSASIPWTVIDFAHDCAGN